ncbi:MAG: prolipoprotein diacylglyceryl transferase [Patescibacteria group bacterium]
MIQPQFNIGPITFHLYGFIIALGAVTGWVIAKKRAKYYKIPEKIFDDYFLLIPLILAVVGARIYHVLDYWDFYKTNFLQVFYIQNGGLGLWGAIAGGILGLFLLCTVKKINFLASLDLIAPSFALAQAIGRIGNYINQEGFGPPTNLPWKIFIEPQNRPLSFITSSYFHPTFFYEASLDLIIFASLLYFSKKVKGNGRIFGTYLILYSTIRFFIELLRIDTWVLGGVKVAQVISIFGIIAGIYLLIAKSKTKPSRLT